MQCYRIAHWNDRYEPRDPKHGKTKGPLRYVELRCHGLQLGVGFRKMQQAAERAGVDCFMVFGVFCKLLEVAASLPQGKRGWLLDHRQQPATIEELAFCLNFNKSELIMAVDLMLDIGWLSYEKIGKKILTNCINAGNGREKPRRAGGIPPTGTGPKKKKKENLSPLLPPPCKRKKKKKIHPVSDSDCALKGSSSRSREKDQAGPDSFPDPIEASGDEAGRKAAVMQLHITLGVGRISDQTKQRSEMGHIYALLDDVDFYCLLHKKSPRRKIYQQVVDLCREKMSYKAADNPRAVFYAACKRRWRQNNKPRASPGLQDSGISQPAVPG